MDKFCTQCGHALSEGARFCTNCGNSLTSQPSQEQRLTQKRAAVMRSGKQQKFNYSKKVVLPLFIIGAAGWLYANLPESGNPILKDAPVVTAPAVYSQSGVQMQDIPVVVENGYVVIPLDIVRDRKFVRFMYGDPTYGTPVLSYISPEGKVVTAISMCEPCNSTWSAILAEPRGRSDRWRPSADRAGSTRRMSSQMRSQMGRSASTSGISPPGNVASET